jgi:uncharacterized protein (TIRG00374 family)
LLRRKRFWFGLVISAGFLAFFLYRTDFGDIAEAFEGADYALALAAVPLYFLGFWIRTMRWHVLMKPVADIPTWRMYPVVLIGLMANNVMPARVGELVRAYLIGEREKVSKSSALGTIAVDRTFDGLTLVAILATVTVFSGTDASVRGIGIATGIVFISATFVLAALAFSPDKARGVALKLFTILPRGIEERMAGFLDSFMAGVQSVRSPSVMITAAVLSFSSWSVEVVMYYVVGEAFHLNQGLHVYYLIAAASNLALSILASPGGVGPFEVTTQAVLIDIYNVSQQQGSAYALALHALLLGPVIIAGFCLLWASQISLSDILGVKKEEAQPQAVAGAAAPAAPPATVPPAPE